MSMGMKHCHMFFFFQAEDGIRDYKVTGVQTCALPISAMAACGWALRTGCSVAARSENVGSGGGTPALEESLCMRYVWTGMATFGSARRATGLVASTRGPAESSGSTR